MADRTTNRRTFNEFSVISDLTQAGGFGNVQKVEQMITSALKPLFEAGQILKRTVSEPGGKSRTTFAFPGGTGIKDMVRIAVQEIVGNLPASGEGIKVSPIMRRQYAETTERILDPRTQAAIRAEAMRTGGMSRFDKESGFTTILVPQKQAARFHAMSDESESRYLAGMGRAAPGYSSSANIVEMAQAAMARKNAQMVAKKQATLDFIKSNPNSPLARQHIKNRRRKTMQMVKGGVAGLLSTIAGLLATGVGISMKILNATLEVARNTLLAMNAGNRVNLSGVDVTRFGGYSEALGYEKGKNPFVDSMNMLVQRFANPERLGDLSSVATLLQGKTADTLKMITTGKVDPEKMLYDIFGDVATSIASGRGGVLKRSDIGGALSSALSSMGTAFDPATADLFNSLITRMMNENKFVGGREYSSGFFKDYIAQLRTGGIVPNENSMAAAAIGAKNINALGTDVNQGINKVLTDLVSWVGDIATSIRNLIAPLLNWLDPAGASKRNAEAVKLNRQYAGETASDISFLGGEMAKEAKNLGLNFVTDKKSPFYKTPSEFVSTMQGEITNFKPGDEEKFKKKYGIDVYAAQGFAAKYAQLVTDQQKLDELNKQLGGGENATTPIPVGADAITRATRGQDARIRYYMDQVNLRTKAEKDLATDPTSQRSKNIIANTTAMGFPNMNEFVVGGNTKGLTDIENDTSVRLAVSALLSSMRQSDLFRGYTIDPSDKLKFATENGELRVVLVEGNKESLILDVKNSAINLEKPFTKDATSLIESANLSTTKQGQGGTH